MLVAVDGKAAGLIAVADPIKESAVAALAALHAERIHVVTLTGDSARRRPRLGAGSVSTMSPRRIVNLADPERLFPAPLGLSGQHNRRAREFPDPSRRATDTRSIPRPLKLTMRAPGDRQGVKSASLCQ